MERTMITTADQVKAYFGKDANYFLKKAKTIKAWGMDPSLKYEGCYEPEGYPKSFEYRGKIPVPPGSTFYNEFLVKVYRPWKKAHPEEVEKREESREKRDEEMLRMKYGIFSIAKRHNLFITWKGDDKDDCHPEEWRLFKEGEMIAVLCIE